MRRLPRFFALILIFLTGNLCFAAGTPGEPAVPPLLPHEFGGWQMQASAKTGNDPTAADPTDAAILKEYGFTDFASATYQRDDGRTLKIRAARFADASGAFGAYTLYLRPEMQKEEIGDQGASYNQRALFYRGNILVDASFSRESPMAAAELRELAGALPRPAGNAGNLPPMLAFMPHRGYVANTEKYAMGPAALVAFAPPLGSDVVDFAAGPEVTLGQYASENGESTLILIYYPTPQLAIEHLRRFAAAHGVQFQSGVSGVRKVGEFFAKRTGPIVAIAAGPLSESDAKSLLGSVNYEANVTWNERTDNGAVRDLYTLFKNIVILCAVLGGFAIVAGIAFGGIRILMKRLYPERVFDRPEQMEFISLHLAEAGSGATQAARGSSGDEGPPPANTP